MHKIDKETVCVKRMRDNEAPNYEEKSPARDTAGHDQIQTMTEDEGDRREFTQRREPHSGSPSPIAMPASTADPSPVRPALQPPPTMTQSTVMSATRG